MSEGIQSLVPESFLPPLLLLHVLGQRPAVVLYGGATVLGLWLLRRRAESLAFLAGLFLNMSNPLVKELVGRPRPDADLVRVYAIAGGEYGFPSGDAQLFTTFFGLLFFLAPRIAASPTVVRLVRAGCASLVLLVGLARVTLGVHWPTDVLGGYLFGGFILWGLLMLYRRLSPRSGTDQRQE